MKEKPTLHDSISEAQTRCLLQGKKSSTVYTQEIKLIQRTEPRPSPSTPKGSLYHSTPILTNLCGFDNVYNGV